jgi:2,3-bisphosphoglycerate-independent phosphoglycerate mutase
MYRYHNWDRTQKALDLFLKGTSELDYPMTPHFYENITTAIKTSHAQNVTDEFIVSARIDPTFKGIHPEEPLFFFNFRSDRMKQLISKMAELLPNNPIVTMTRYDKNYGFDVVFEKESITNTVGEILSGLNMTQLRATETEKFPHVTYFFNGGVEVTFKGELRSLAESNKVKHDQMPEMQAERIANNIRKQVETDHPDFILVNFANPDMVGHTGNFQAVVTGVQKVDAELKELTDYLTSKGYICCITADHGNADIMYDLETNEPHTAHTLNPVPFIIYDPLNKNNQKLTLDHNPANGLSKIAGTVFDLMEIKKQKHDFDTLIK